MGPTKLTDGCSAWFKKAVICVLAVAAPSMMVGQCVADAGMDTIICNSWDGVPVLQLGGQPVASGGVPPYSYAWSAEFEFTIGSNTYYFSASDFLDDTTLANPQLVDPFDELWYTVTVTDSLGTQCSDSLFVRMANFGTHLGYWTFYIQQGDSVQFLGDSNCMGAYGPMSYVWHPNESLSDSTSLTAWASPAVSTAYSLTGTDSHGCSATAPPLNFVNVTPLGVSGPTSRPAGSLLYPQPLVDLAWLQLEGPDRIGSRLHVLDGQGRIVRSETIRSDPHPLHRGDLASGRYLWMVTGPAGLSSGSFLVE
ncbi:MAG: hypothetical protein KDC02_22990 [Flavobacteriales bacterium]|nr:hypothetical protein [Flavobacteriales bacterium]